MVEQAVIRIVGHRPHHIDDPPAEPFLPILVPVKKGFLRIGKDRSRDEHLRAPTLHTHIDSLDQIRDLISPELRPRLRESLYECQRILLGGRNQFGSLIIRDPSVDPIPKSVERTP